MFTTIHTHLQRCGRLAAVLISLAVCTWTASLATTAGPLGAGPAHALVAGGAPGAGSGATTIEKAASKATSTVRSVAASVIGLGMCLAGLVLAFKRDFSWAAAAIGCGLVALFLSSNAGFDSIKNFVDHVVA